MTDEEIKSLTPKQLAKHPAIQALKDSLRHASITHEHEEGCDNDGMDTCPCGHTQLWYAMRDLGIDI